MEKSWFFWLLAAVLAVIALLIIYTCGPWAWQWLRYGGSAPVETHGATLRNIGLLVAGIIALPLALWRSFVAQSQAKSAEGQLNVMHQSLRQERYQRGVEMLGNEWLSTRMGGIYALLGLAEDYPEEFHLQVMKPLCAFVRNPYGIDKPMDRDMSEWESLHMQFWESRQSTPFREDIQTIIYAIGNRSAAARYLEKEQDYRLDLTSADFTFADLSDVDLSGTDLTSALFIGARCNHTNFSGAVLRHANFFAARCTEANMSDTILERARLDRSTMTSTDFSNSVFEGPGCRQSTLFLSKFCHAKFIDAHLEGAEIEKADLSGATFDTKINPVNQRNRSYSHLTQEQLDKAVAALDNPPSFLFDAADPDTGKELVWHDNPPPLRSGTSV